MPTIAQSANISRRGLTPAGAPGAQPIMTKPIANTIVPQASTQMSPFMHCSMPVIAATYDSLSRQFYGNPRVPVTRILPP
jgi:hypothetical protein